MYSDEDYKEEDEEIEPSSNGNKLQEFYQNNKKLVWIAGVILLIAIISLILPSGSGSKKGVVISAGGESLTEKSISRGTSITLSVTVDGQTSSSLVWDSSNNNVATVSNGLVMGVSTGTAVITVKDTQTSKTGTCTIKVVEGNPDVLLTDVKFPDGDFIMSVGSKANLDLVASPATGYIESKTFTSSASDIVRVNADGTIEGVKEGAARITVDVNNGKFSRSTMVRVVKKSVTARFVTSVESLTFASATDKVAIGQTKKLDFRVSPSSADDITIMWESSNPSIVTVDEEGNITGVAVGNALIKARTLAMKDIGTVTIEVINDNFVVSANPTSVSLGKGETKYVTLTLTPSTASRSSLTFETTDINVATVASNDGGNTIQIGGINTGTAYAVVKAGGVEKLRIPITVGSIPTQLPVPSGGNTETDPHANKGYKISSRDADGNGYINRTYSQIKNNCGKGPLTITFSGFDSSIDTLRVCKYKYGGTKCNPDTVYTTIHDGDTYEINEQGEWVILVSEYKGSSKKRSTLDWYACLGTSGSGSATSSPSTSACYCNPLNSKCTFASSSSSTYTDKQTQITTATGCLIYSNNDENGCFTKSNGEHVWGGYGKTSGYTNVGLNSANTKDKCLALNKSGTPTPTATATAAANTKSINITGGATDLVAFEGKEVSVTSSNADFNRLYLCVGNCSTTNYVNNASQIDKYYNAWKGINCIDPYNRGTNQWFYYPTSSTRQFGYCVNIHKGDTLYLAVGNVNSIGEINYSNVVKTTN